MGRRTLKDDAAPTNPVSAFAATYGITQEDAALLRTSWLSIEGDATGIGELFYRKLFELSPQLRKRFPEDMTAQREKLMATLSHAVAFLDRLGTLEEDLRALGRRHVGYGASEVDYSAVGDALMWTLERGLGEAWSVDVERAWEKTFSALSQVMIRASRGTER